MPRGPSSWATRTLGGLGPWVAGTRAKAGARRAPLGAPSTTLVRLPLRLPRAPLPFLRAGL
eukprot:10454176-Alexandrium_andersonii.AAC.1